MTATPLLRVRERYDASRSKLVHILDGLRESNSVQLTVYLRPGSHEALASDLVTRHPGLDAALADAVHRAGDPDTGVVAFWEQDTITAVVPPFPVTEGLASAGLDTGHLMEILGRELRVGVVLVRLGRFAVGVLDGETLVASKTDTRYVKSRHRAGGSSQRRFERSRERLVRELYDKVCVVVADTFAPFADGIDYVLLGGEKTTLGGLVRRCAELRRLAPITLGRRLDVRRPGQKALDGVHHEVWQSRVVVFGRAEID